MIQTVSLETAKALEDAGFNHETYFMYGTWNGEMVLESKKTFYRHKGPDNTDQHCISAPTTDEILEDLPAYIEIKKNMVTYLRIELIAHDRSFRVQYQRKFDEGSKTSDRIPVNPICERLLSEALAQMWLWLKKEGLLK